MAFENDENFDKESYVGVNERLLDFYKKHPEGRVETSVTVVGDGIIVKASLYRKPEDIIAAATGHSFLTDIAGDKVGEYTETVAVGRALAFMGFRVEKAIASAQEITRYNKAKGGEKKETKETKKKDEERAETLAKASDDGQEEKKEVEEAPKEQPTLRANKFRLPSRAAAAPAAQVTQND